MTTAVEKAQQILAADPLPQDAREQIAALKKDMLDFQYEQLLEGLAVQEMLNGQFET